jgi:hypothetical protein
LGKLARVVSQAILSLIGLVIVFRIGSLKLQRNTKEAN